MAGFFNGYCYGTRIVKLAEFARVIAGTHDFSKQLARPVHPGSYAETTFHADRIYYIVHHKAPKGGAGGVYGVGRWVHEQLNPFMTAEHVAAQPQPVMGLLIRDVTDPKVYTVTQDLFSKCATPDQTAYVSILSPVSRDLGFIATYV